MIATEVRQKLAEIGRRWAVSLVQLVELTVELDESGEWALDGSPTCAHWIAAALDVEVSTAREWLRVGRALRTLPLTGQQFASGALSYTKVRALTRLATPENEGELCDLAEYTPAGRLGVTLAAWSARHEDEVTRNDRHESERGMRWRTQPDGPVDVTMRITPAQIAIFSSTVDAQVMRRAHRRRITKRGADASASRESHVEWDSLAQQRVDALVEILEDGGTNVTTEVILHVRADGCTLDDGTPIAESHPINLSGRHRHHTDRQKRVVKEIDRCCADCGSTDLPEYDHTPDFDESRRTLVEESRLRCSICHAARHRSQREARARRSAS